jgi:hypothetical protein
MRSLRQIAQPWPIAELKIVLCLTNRILPCTTTEKKWWFWPLILPGDVVILCIYMNHGMNNEPLIL